MPAHTFYRDRRDRFTASTFAVAELISLVFQRRILRGFGQRRKLRRVLEEVRRG